EVDALIAIFIQPLRGELGAVAAAIGEAAAAGRRIPVQAVLIPAAGRPAERPRGVPLYRYPEEAAAAPGKVARHAEWRRRPPAPRAAPGELRPDEAAAVLAEALAAGREWLAPAVCERLLDCYGIAVPAARPAADPAAAGAAAAEIGGVVALKAAGP